jgi:hypothetical protein
MMKEPWSEFSPYWWQMPFGANVGLLAPPAQPNTRPWENSQAHEADPQTRDPSTLTISTGDGGMLAPPNHSWDRSKSFWRPSVAASSFCMDHGLPAPPAQPPDKPWIDPLSENKGLTA